MELFFGRHSRLRLQQRDVTEASARSVVDNPDRVERREPRKTHYYGRADGRSIIVVVAYDVTPPFVVTVMDDWEAS